MKEYDRRPRLDRPQQPPFANLVLGMKLFVAFMGMLIMLIGVVMAIKLFAAVYTALTGPNGLSGTFATWTRALGGDTPETRMTTLAVLGLGAVFLAALTITLIRLGAGMISNASAELVALREMLFGEPPQDAPPPPPDRPEYPYPGSGLEAPRENPNNSALD